MLNLCNKNLYRCFVTDDETSFKVDETTEALRTLTYKNTSKYLLYGTLYIISTVQYELLSL